MSKRWIKAGATQQSIDLFILDSSSTTGAGLTGLSSSSSGLVCYYRKGITGSAQQLTLSTAGTIGTAWTTGGNFIAVDGTNMPGVYRLDLLNSMVDTAGMLTIMLRGATNMAPVVAELEVVSVDIYDSTRLGLSALPNAAAEALGGLATLSANQTSNGTIPVNVKAIAGQTANASAAVTFPASIGTSTLDAGGAADAVWDEVLSGHLTSGSTGAALNAAGAAGDPWSTSIPGAYGAGTAGYIVGTNLDAAITSRLASGNVTVGSIASNAITAASIQNGAITNVKFAAGAITSSVFATDAITSTVIAADAITSAELAASSVYEIADAVWKADADTPYGGGNYGGATFGDRIPRVSNAAENTMQITNTNHVSASVHEMQSGVVTAASIAAGAIDANAIAANAIDASALAADAIAEIADGVWDEVLSGHLTAGTTGKALSDASTGGGGGGGSTTVRMGPFTVKAEGQASDLPLDINLGATHGVDCKLVDAQGTGVDLTGATLSTKVYSTSGTLVATISGTATYAAGGDMTWTIPTSVTNTAGTYTATITRTTGASDTEVFGPLRIYVRDI